eukprot:3505954-Pyramimonas_sp.AAC.1
MECVLAIRRHTCVMTGTPPPTQVRTDMVRSMLASSADTRPGTPVPPARRWSTSTNTASARWAYA